MKNPMFIFLSISFLINALCVGVYYKELQIARSQWDRNYEDIHYFEQHLAGWAWGEKKEEWCKEQNPPLSYINESTYDFERLINKIDWMQKQMYGDYLSDYPL